MSPRAQPAIVMTCAALLLTSVHAGAQPPVPISDAANQQETLNAAERRSAVNGALARLADPTRRSVGSGPAPTFILEASSTTKIAGARIGFQYRDWLLDIKLQGVVDGTSRQAVFADLDGLRYKSTVEFGLLWTSYPSAVAREKLDAACRQYEQAQQITLPRRPCSIRDLRHEGPNGALAAAETPQLHAAEEVARWLAPRRLFLAGVSYTFGPERFSFVPTPTASSETETRVNWALTARAGLVASEALSYGAEYARVVEYHAGNSRQICVPLGDTGVLECVNRAVGGVTMARTHVLTLEVRRLFGPTVAVNPRLSVNPSSGGVRFDLPVYFLHNAKGGLAGGVTMSWRHFRTTGSTIELTAFVGQVFGLILR
ncbi:MAG: hypothetical protein NTV05_17540 [Acidobacteria bacterium]|nr:hypothetical protein [Acidobacteriota bacterium]